MATTTDKKIAPLQDNINDIQAEVSTLTTQIAKAQKDKTSYVNATTAAKKLSDKYWALRNQTFTYFRNALKLVDKLLAKNRKVCGGGYYQGVCKEAISWANEVNQWTKRTEEQIANKKEFATKAKVTQDLLDNLTAEKIAKQSEIQDIQDQIDQIIADDIAVAATDPTVLVATEEAKSELAKLEAEGKQRNLVILGVLVVIVIIGSIVALKS